MLWTAGTDFDVNICDWYHDLDVLVSENISERGYSIYFHVYKISDRALVQNAL